jgi:nucleoside-diphosphate-sugar epimerase
LADLKRIVVTGGSGKAGRWAVKRLVEEGYEVKNVDIAPPKQVAEALDARMSRRRSSRDSLQPSPSQGEGIGLPFQRADLTDYGQAIDALKGADAVVHLAAIPAPGVATDEVTFRTNVTSTYNIFLAAVTLGLKRVVWASSETVLGLPFQTTRPDYAPIDEMCTRLPQTAYALSKLTGEELAKQFARWSAGASIPETLEGSKRQFPFPFPGRERVRVRVEHSSPSRPEGTRSSPAGRGGGIPFIGLRFSNVIVPGDFPPDADEGYARFARWQDDPRTRAWNFWGYVDARDCALACQRALEVDTSAWGPGPSTGSGRAIQGSVGLPEDSGSSGLAQVFIIAAADTVMERPNTELLAEVYPDVPVRGRLSRNGTLLSIGKARRMLGFEPEHSWRGEVKK